MTATVTTMNCPHVSDVASHCCARKFQHDNFVCLIQIKLTYSTDCCSFKLTRIDPCYSVRMKYNTESATD